MKILNVVFKDGLFSKDVRKFDYNKVKVVHDGKIMSVIDTDNNKIVMLLPVRKVVRMVVDDV